MIVTRARLSPPEPLVLALPSPPPCRGFGRCGRGEADAAARWCEEALAALKRQRPRRFTGEVAIDIVFANPKRRSEIGARLPPLLMFLVRSGILPASDSTVVRRLSAAFADIEGCRLTLSAAP